MEPTHNPLKLRTSFVIGKNTPMSLSGFDRTTIEDAKRVLNGNSPWFAFDDDGHLQTLYPALPPSKSCSPEKLSAQLNRDFWAEHRRILPAIVALISQSIQLPSAKAAQDELNDGVKLAVKSKNEDWLDVITEDAREQEEAFYLNRDGLENGIKQLDEHLKQLQRVLNGETPSAPIPVSASDRDDPNFDPWDETLKQIQEQRWWDSKCLIKDAACKARVLLQDDDFNRFHNTLTEAVNFIRASREAAFLLSSKGGPEPIKDVASFMASPWALLLANVDMWVDPKLLANAREQALGNAIRHS